VKYDLDWVIKNFEKGVNLKYIFFWGHQKSKSGHLTLSCFSQWWTSPFDVEGVRYNTAEHWMMAQKALLFDDKHFFEKIILAKSPAEAKSLGRKIRDFDEKVWIEKRTEIVVKGNLQKFKQCPNLKQFLIDTKNKVLVEASPFDKIWGIGLAEDNEKIKNPKCWKGLNLLGFALMEVRDILKNDER
jgi:ribA/ribD-fused uncharacterized protein